LYHIFAVFGQTFAEKLVHSPASNEAACCFCHAFIAVIP